MKLYIYDLDTMEVIAIADGEANQECENKAQPYTNEYGTTYTPAFGMVGGLIDNNNAEIL